MPVTYPGLAVPSSDAGDPANQLDRLIGGQVPSLCSHPIEVFPRKLREQAAEQPVVGLNLPGTTHRARPLPHGFGGADQPCRLLEVATCSDAERCRVDGMRQASEVPHPVELGHRLRDEGQGLLSVT